MKLTILGSGTLFPYPNRGNSGYLLETSKNTILLDGGSGTLRKIADFGFDYSKIDTICYTHLHIDHTFDLIPLLFALKNDKNIKKSKTLNIIAPNLFNIFFDKLYNIYYQWIDSPKITINIIEIKFWPFQYILQIPLWLGILFSLFLGIILGSSLMLISQIKTKLSSSQLNSQLIKYQNLNNSQKIND